MVLLFLGKHCYHTTANTVDTLKIRQAIRLITYTYNNYWLFSKEKEKKKLKKKKSRASKPVSNALPMWDFSMASFQWLSDWEEIDHVSMHIVNKLRMAVHLLDEHHLQSANQAQDTL